MKTKGILKLLALSLLWGAWIVGTATSVSAQEPLKYSCSNQIYAAFEKEKIAAFTEATGVKVDVKTGSSGACTYRLMSGGCDIASTARKLYPRHEIYGYREFAFCKDPIAVIAKKGCGAESLNEEQLEDIFAGEITNWKEVGGVDLPIMVVVPDTDTAAHKNFRRQVMKTKDIEHDFMAHDSTMVIEAIKHFPCGTISFISRGATEKHPEIKTLKVNGLLPTDKEYPYHQTFYYVTKGDPAGNLKKFIDFTYSEEGAKIIRAHGMIPLAR